MTGNAVDDDRPDVLELLAALTARGLDIEHIPGGPPGSLYETVAHALGAMHHPRSANILQAKFMHDVKSGHLAWSQWFMDVCARAQADGWRDRRRGRHELTLDRLSTYTFEEWLGAQRCSWCKGSGLQPNGTPGCSACAGIGLVRVSGRSDADALGFTPEGYRTSAWPARVHWCRSELRRQELEARERFKDALRGRLFEVWEALLTT